MSKNTNLKTFADFIHFENDRVVITINQTAFNQDISIIDNYIRKIENINSEHINTF